MKQYTQLKISRQKGISKIPSSWDEIPLQYLKSNESNSFTDGPFGSRLKSSEYVNSGVMLIQLHNVGDGIFYPNNQTFITEEKFQSLRKHNAIPGDVVVSKMADPIARACLIPNLEPKYFIVSDCIRLRTNDTVNNQFLVYSINSPYFRQKAISFGGGSTRQRIQLTQLKKLFIILPEIQIQNQISNYLCSKIQEIDNEIDKNQKLIELFEEKRQSVINQAVTKGLDDTVPMKDSGVEWIGKIPKHWNAIKLKYCLKINGFKSGPFGSNLITSKLLNHGKILVYTPEHLDGDVFEQQYIPTERESELSNYLVKYGDIILPIVGTLGRCKLIHQKDPIGIMNQRLCRITLNEKKLVRTYVELLIKKSFLMKNHIDFFKRGAILDHITKDVIFNTIFPVPPISEQHGIIEYFDKEIEKYDSLILKIKSQVEKLNEFKQSLISSAVTGEIQVAQA